MNPGALPPKKRYIPTAQWEKYFFGMIISWCVFIIILLFVSYYPPPQSSSSSIWMLCEGVKFIAYTMTGATIGYPIGEGAASAENKLQ